MTAPNVQARSSVEISNPCNNCFPFCCKKEQKQPVKQADQKLKEVATSTFNVTLTKDVKPI